MKSKVQTSMLFNKSVPLLLCSMSLLFSGCVGQDSSDENVVILEAESTTTEETETDTEEADIEEETDQNISENCLVTDTPYYGSATYPSASLALEYTLDNTDNQEFELILADNEYGFFMFPAALGEATFFGGAWGGAAWEPDDETSTATRNEPVVIVKDNTHWFVYRTDYPGGGRLLSKVSYTNPGQAIGASSPCETDGLKQADESTFVFDLTNAQEYSPPVAEILPPPSINNNNEICTMNGLPVYGGIDLTILTREKLSQTFLHTGGQDFELTLAENEYGFFAYPAALGKADFFDRNFINARGGWHGATWTPYDGATSEEMNATTPIITEIGETKWYVYRTDFPGLGETKYAVRFANPGLAIGDEVSCDMTGILFEESQNLRILLEEETEEESEVEEPMPHTTIPDTVGQCTFSAMPRYGGRLGSIGLASEVLALEEESSSLTDLIIKLTLTEPEFGIFAYPAALGETVFRDKNSGFLGGWDGITWHLNNSRDLDGYADRPLVTKVDGVSWFIYRTDFSEIFSIEFLATFANQGLSLGDTVECDLSSFDHVSTGRVIGDDLNAVKIFVAGGTDVLLEEGIVEQSVAGQGRWSINTSYFGVDGRDSPDPTKFNEAGLYDMFFYNSAGISYGPFSITVEEGEIKEKDFDTTSL